MCPAFLGVRMAYADSESRGRVLVVEDELLIGLDLQATIEQAGFSVIGPVPSIRKAMEAIEKDAPDAALLDANLAGISSLPIAEALRVRGIPFGVVSGYAALDAEGEALRAAPRMDKPFNASEVVRLLQRLCDDRVRRRTAAVDVVA